jgi:hypothetical protein
MFDTLSTAKRSPKPGSACRGNEYKRTSNTSNDFVNLYDLNCHWRIILMIC